MVAKKISAWFVSYELFLHCCIHCHHLADNAVIDGLRSMLLHMHGWAVG